MPFCTPDLPPRACGHELFPASFVSRGETVNGDAVFPETGRADGGFLFLLIDVAGHGPAAATLVDEVRRLLQDPICENVQPAALFRTLNDMLQQSFAATNRFVAALAVLIAANGGLFASNAGQPEPWVGVPGQTWASWAVPGGTFLGVAQPGEVYDQEAIALGTGHCLLAFTDGVPEAGRWRGRGGYFGPRLGAFLDDLPAGVPAGQVVVRLLQALQVHVGSEYPVTEHGGAIWPEDDTTVIGVRRV